MPLNPAIAQVLELIAKARRPPFHTLTAEAARASYERSALIIDIAPAPMFDIQELTIPTRDGASIRARLFHPVEPAWTSPAPTLVYFHGGGFVVGSIDTHAALCRRLAADSGCAVVSVDYRLAPEHKFPSAVHDAFDALEWLHEQAASLGLDSTRFAVGGDSAGGTLSTVCAVLARDAGIALRLQLLIYPGVSARQDTRSYAQFAEGYVLSAKTVEWFFKHYLRNENDRDDWRFAPLDARGEMPSLEGVAPAWIAAADHDPLFDENIAYAAKLERERVPVELVRYEGMTHEFFKMGGLVPDVAKAHADAANALREYLSATES
ncbi:esterase/lipase [Caballeronia sordidicola]|uniref:Esterase/lipase n=1 Tax=Caballeronia sordidicola TaxID=196367 RepID=A0A158H547_CABSO|nr:alpha/beta hydrolase [Caballeronia sordidicola]SAL39416.1 esterase/lipase [Caballeronia sordidicola]